MAKNTVNATMRTSKQQISKILMSQMASYLTSVARWMQDDHGVRDSIVFKIVRSRAYTNEQISSWSSDQFMFRFEYGSRHSSVRVSYVNSDGLISAVFGADEWQCLCDFIEKKLNSIVEKRLNELKQDQTDREQREFDRKVADAVEKALAERRCMDVHAMHKSCGDDTELRQLLCESPEMSE